MEITVDRKYPKALYVIGKLYINGQYFCDTIEDTDRGLKQTDSLQSIKKRKVYGETAIPKGTYEVAMNIISPKYSQRPSFSYTKGYMPRLLNVPGYEGVLIHTGNTQYDSYGCLIVGVNKVKGKVVDSTVTFKNLYSILRQAADRGERITITIK